MKSLFRKKTFQELYYECNDEFDWRRVKRLVQAASTNAEIMLLFSSPSKVFLECYYEFRSTLVDKLDKTQITPEDRILLNKVTHETKWLMSEAAYYNSLPLSILAIESLFDSKGLKTEGWYYEHAVESAVRLGLKQSDVSLDDLSIIYGYSKNRKIWNKIKAISGNDFKCWKTVLDRLGPKHKIAYLACLRCATSVNDLELLSGNDRYIKEYAARAIALYSELLKKHL